MAPPPDRLSALPDDVIAHVLSFLPTPVSAATSVLSRRYRHLWASVPDLNLDHTLHRSIASFESSADAAFRRRDPSVPLRSLRLRADERTRAPPRWLLRAARLGVRRLALTGHACACFLALAPELDLAGLRSLDLRYLSRRQGDKYPLVPEGIRLPALESMELVQVDLGAGEVTQLVAACDALCSLNVRPLADLEVLDLRSPTLRRLRISCLFCAPHHTELRLECASLEFLVLENSGNLQAFRALPMPELRTAAVTMDLLTAGDMEATSVLIRSVASVQELRLHLTESKFQVEPFPLLAEHDQPFPSFPNLKTLDLSMCFHEYNIPGLITMLQQSPVLQSIKLTHLAPRMLAKTKKRRQWASKLPRNSSGNYRFASVNNFHSEERNKLLYQLSRRLKTKAKRSS
ncbi:hypothetical protein ACP70R_012093 [Stipagrostis hirtigluma subsp. patula]